VPRHVVALFALVLVACGEAPPRADDDDAAPTSTPTVLLVSLDTTRADRLGAYGHAAARTPVIDALAAGGLRFDAARAPTPITLPSHTPLLTGTLPTAHGVRDNTIFRAGEGCHTLAEALRARGWRTGGFVGSYVLDARFGLAQGFETYTGPDAGGLGASPEVVERRGAAVVDDALAWIDGVPAGEPAFLWAHLYDPHHPYAAPEPWAGTLPDPYDAELAYADAQLGRLLDGLRARRDVDGVRVLLTSDHGEALGEHGEPTHGLFVYDATVRVPLVLHGAGVRPGVVARPVSLADVAPTILAWVGLPGALLPDAGGRSLLEAPREPPPVYVESLLPWHTRRWHPLRGLVWRGHKYVESARPELYDLAADPGETRDLLAEAPDAAQAELAAHLAQRLAALRAEHGPLGWAADEALAPAEAERLAALGYVAGVQGAAPTRDPSLPDPKDRVDDLHAFHEARALLRQGREQLGLDGGGPPDDAARAAGEAALQRAEALLRQLLERTPDDPSLPGHLGLVLLSQGRPAEALPWFERAARVDPQPLVTGLNRAQCHALQGQDARARELVRELLGREPRFAAAYDWLVTHHEAAGRFGRAAWWRDAELRTGPGDARKVALLTDGARLRERARDAGQPVAGPDER